MHSGFDLRGGVDRRACSLVPGVVGIHNVDLVIQELGESEVVAVSGEQFHVYIYVYIII